MKIKSSPLEFIDFYVLNTNFKFIKPVKEDIDIETLFKKYEADINFSLKLEKKINLLVFIRVKINDDKNNLAGYQIIAEGVAIFNIQNIRNLNQRDKSNLMYFSSLSIAINNIRNYISMLTSSAPLGKYVLPAVDVNDLHKQKKAAMRKKR